MSTPYRFERIFLEKVWGGRALEKTPGIALPDGLRVGETWELVDRTGENSIVAEGADAGRSLRELLATRGREILGNVQPNAAGRFPLLVKYIAANENLSIQVHPDDAAAARLGAGAEGKTEAWYVLGAEPGASVYVGLDPAVTAADFAARATRPGAEEMLTRFEVTPGDCIAVHGGTVHAIGAGVTLLEVQQNSDTTYRVYDWGRVGLDGAPRATHVEAALAVARFGERSRPPMRAAQAGWTARGAALRTARLSRTDYFAIDVHEIRGTARMSSEGGCAIYVVVAGTGHIAGTRDAGTWPLRRGDTWLLPASLDEHELVSDDGPMTLIELTATP
jgi:mannose-6-phosphate isomerase